MKIVQKLKVDGELTGNMQVVVRDETGLYNASNKGGYGGANGNAPNTFQKYIFDLINLDTGDKYRQVQSDDINNPSEYYNPTVESIVNKENVTISAVNFELDTFDDGIYKLIMNVKVIANVSCNGNIGTEVVSNVVNAANIFENYNAIIVGNEIYKIQGITGNNLVLDRNIVSTFVSFSPIISTTMNFIISDTLNDNIDITIANLAKQCGCNDDKIVNAISEIQLYYWAMNRSLDENDIFQAYEYFKVAKDLSCSINFN